MTENYFYFTGTEIKTEASVQDNYKPDNLTSSNILLKKTGFLVDYFIRPPVTLEIKFEHEISLSHIYLETKVGQQKSKGIEIWIEDFKLARKIVDENSVIFQNFSFPGNRFKAEDKPKVRLAQPELLRNVKSFKIRIFCTFQSSVPCLANLQIWGIPAEKNSDKTKLEIGQIWSAIVKARSNISVVTKPVGPTKNTPGTYYLNTAKLDYRVITLKLHTP